MTRLLFTKEDIDGMHISYKFFADKSVEDVYFEVSVTGREGEKVGEKNFENAHSFE